MSDNMNSTQQTPFELTGHERLAWRVKNCRCPSELYDEGVRQIVVLPDSEDAIRVIFESYPLVQQQEGHTKVIKLKKFGTPQFLAQHAFFRKHGNMEPDADAPLLFMRESVFRSRGWNVYMNQQERGTSGSEETGRMPKFVRYDVDFFRRGYHAQRFSACKLSGKQKKGSEQHGFFRVHLSAYRDDNGGGPPGITAYVITEWGDKKDVLVVCSGGGGRAKSTSEKSKDGERKGNKRARRETEDTRDACEESDDDVPILPPLGSPRVLPPLVGSAPSTADFRTPDSGQGYSPVAADNMAVSNALGMDYNELEQTMRQLSIKERELRTREEAVAKREMQLLLTTRNLTDVLVGLVREGNVGELRRMFEQNEQIGVMECLKNINSERKGTLLHLAAEHDKVEVGQFLVNECKMDRVVKKRDNASTPCHVAFQFHSASFVHNVLNARKNPMILWERTLKGWTPLHSAYNKTLPFEDDAEFAKHRRTRDYLIALMFESQGNWDTDKLVEKLREGFGRGRHFLREKEMESEIRWVADMRSGFRNHFPTVDGWGSEDLFSSLMSVQ